MRCTIIDIRGDYAFVKYEATGVVSEVAIALLPFGADVGDQLILRISNSLWHKKRSHPYWMRSFIACRGVYGLPVGFSEYRPSYSAAGTAGISILLCLAY